MSMKSQARALLAKIIAAAAIGRPGARVQFQVGYHRAVAVPASSSRRPAQNSDPCSAAKSVHDFTSMGALAGHMVHHCRVMVIVDSSQGMNLLEGDVYEQCV
jgi:hypothetical protein